MGVEKVLKVLDQRRRQGTPGSSLSQQSKKSCED